MMSIVEEKRLNFANVLKKACSEARNATVMVVPTFNHAESVDSLLSELSVEDSQETFPFIESNSPSKMLTPTCSPSSRFAAIGNINNSNERNRMDFYYETNSQELCNNNLLSSPEIICKQNITLTEEDHEFLGIIGELNIHETKVSSDLSLYVANEGNKEDNLMQCYQEQLADQNFMDLTTYISNNPGKVYFQTEYYQSEMTSLRYQPYPTKSKELSPEEILKRKERNRVRSKAYRLRKKLQFEALQQEVEAAKIAAAIAQKDKVVAEVMLEVSENQQYFNNEC
ncbi:uncharacterized protein [Antedon mediterranea]|uniref:uncharacterized protein n=1 Tax=Antedon mediterranea TaxID=105859 RepID=UPI003AF4106D